MLAVANVNIVLGSETNYYSVSILIILKVILVSSMMIILIVNPSKYT
jgi:hypothetical protein